MDDDLSKIYFDEQLEFIRNANHVVEHHGWKMNIEDFDILITMYPKKFPEKQFLIRLRCTEYPKRAPSLQFLDPDTKQEGAKFWPQVGPFQAAISRSRAQPQLCIPGIREFHEGCHASDSSKPWNPGKYPFIIVLESTQTLLDKWFT